MSETEEILTPRNTVPSAIRSADEVMFEALQRIIARANTDEPGTSKVRDMEKIARAALSKAQGAP